MPYTKARKISQFKNFNNKTMMIGRTLSFENIKSISDQTMPKGGTSQGVFNMMYVAGMGCLSNKFFKDYGGSIKEGELVSFGFTEKGDGDFWIKFYVLKENGCFGIKHIELDVESFEKNGYSYDDCIMASSMFSQSVYLEINPKTGEIANAKQMTASA